MFDFLRELVRRKVWLFGGIYLALGWIVLQVAVVIESTLELPGWIDQSVLVLLALGFPFALLLAWAQESSATTTPATPSDVSPEEMNAAKPGFSVAVLALNNLSDERELDWIADGLSEDILTRLGMVNYMTVTARNSSFAFKGQTPDIREVGRVLNVRYVIEGSVRLIDETLRVTVQLIDAETGGHVWSDNYDHSRAALGGMQDKVVDVVFGQVAPTVLDLEINRIMRAPLEDLSVWDICALCWGKATKNPSAEGTSEAIDLMRQGLVRFPEAADLHVELAYYCCRMGLTYDRENRTQLLSATEDHLQEAIRISPRTNLVLWRHAIIRQMLGQFQEARVVGEQLAKLYPRHALLPILAMTYMSLGRYDEALERVDRCLETMGTKHFDRQQVLGFKGDIYLGLGDFKTAEAALREALGVLRQPAAQRSLIVALAHQGKLDDARAECETYEELPNAQSLVVATKSLRRNSKDPAWIEMYLEGLEIAGLH